ncbi:anhydro-N-acetylmuramic acid kinase [Ruicaihuangia caeni]|uniref:Anhydro-N-acetylmuramic acid kinase n=1 Tax=Ruicaihuangia caeni TaxID=3042517 RepID=A0AAW6T4C7_9MICO|nr:anhydro-N-acetylmuramic acid kinase [Klugiella sp. YN-L-19]MDI2098675.1 anhydro-N-acetylmuramic acid kinase [Klugiella sp. YN-L-19]
MRVLGLISGTSHDGIDAAIVDFRLEGDTLHGTVEHTASTPYAGDLRRRIIDALPPAQTTMREVCELDTLIGQAFAAAAESAIEGAAGAVDLICSHGQTMYHWVDGDRALGTLQLGQPAWIAERTGISVLADVRIRDITAGGHGAPLVSYLDTLLLGGLGEPAAALNLGGISNMTVIAPDAEPYAYDIGPANALIDAVVTANGIDDGFDRDGAIAASGTIDEALLEQLLEEPYYRLPVPKSTGKELFSPDYIDTALERYGRPVPFADLVATLTELTARTVAADVRRAGVTTLVASGGGCANPHLMKRLEHALPGVTIRCTDEFGAPAGEKEAIAFALLGWASLHAVPAIVPSCTGAGRASVLGALTPGREGFVVPAAAIAPAALVLRAH